MVAIGNAHCLCVLPCDFKHILPISRIDVCSGILFCHGYTESAVTCGNIENLMCFSAFAQFGGHDLGGHMH